MTTDGQSASEAIASLRVGLVAEGDANDSSACPLVMLRLVLLSAHIEASGHGVLGRGLLAGSKVLPSTFPLTFHSKGSPWSEGSHRFREYARLPAVGVVRCEALTFGLKRQAKAAKRSQARRA